MKWCPVNTASKTIGSVAVADDGALLVKCVFGERRATKAANLKMRYYAHGPRCATAWRDTPEEAMRDYENGIWVQTNETTNNQEDKSKNATDE